MDSNAGYPLVKSVDIYTLGELVVAPYPDQDFLGDAYFRFKAQGLLSLFFHEDSSPKTLYDFLSWCMERNSLLLGAYRASMRTDGSARELIGIAKVGVPVTVAASGHQKSEVGMIFQRDYQDRSWTIPACQMMIELTFDRTNIDVLYGTIPERNRASLRFMKAIGFEFVGPIQHYTAWKGQKCGAYVSWMDAERWREVSPFR